MNKVRETNIGPRLQRRRRISGFVLVGAGASIVAAQTVLSAPLAWRLFAAIPFFGAANLLLQAHHKT